MLADIRALAKPVLSLYKELEIIMNFKKYPNELTFNTHALKFALKDYLEKLSKRVSWMGPAGILATLVSTILVTDFQEKMGVSAAKWEALYFITIIICTIWLIRVCVLMNSRKPQSFDDFFFSLTENAVFNLSECVLLISTGKGKDNIPRILVYYDSFRGSFYLPWVAKHVAKPGSTQATRAVQDMFGIDPDIVNSLDLDMLQLKTEKKSESSGKMKHYNFDFAFVGFKSTPKAGMKKSPFIAGGKTYYWVTVGEMEEHTQTRAKNFDVFNHINKNSNDIFDKKIGFSMTDTISLTNKHKITNSL